jgi:hypothetical protein
MYVLFTSSLVHVIRPALVVTLFFGGGGGAAQVVNRALYSAFLQKHIYLFYLSHHCIFDGH